MTKTATATRKRAAKTSAAPEQKDLTGGDGKPIAGERITELEDVGMALDGVRKRRMALNKEEEKLQNQGLEVMKAHGIVTAYKLRDGRFLTREHEEKDKLKIRDPEKEGRKKKKQGGRTGQADFGGE
jgi:hypothetical protein